MSGLPQHSQTMVLLDKLVPDAEAVACLSETAARRLNVVPMALSHDADTVTLLVGSADPENTIIEERVGRQLPHRIRLSFIQVDAQAIPGALDRCYRCELSAHDLIHCCAHDAHADQRELQWSDITVQLVDALLIEAYRRRASDIHLSPTSDSVLVRLRIDGVLNTFVELKGSLLPGLIVRIKILSDLDIAESRLPQDGQFVRWFNGRYVDFRTSSFPTLHGENLVLRIMSVQSCSQSIATLNLSAPVANSLRDALRKPEGLVVVCGPTGAGKTTTLYALLNELDKASLNIMTLEDPVEIRSQGIRQTSIDPVHGLSYAQGLRALLRQDPDVLMVGEVRDSDSCRMMLRAAMTGHRVLTTVHAKSVFGAIERLSELGGQANLLADHLTAVVSQRLIRLICQDCRGEHTERCRCKGTGFFGRQLIMELLPISPALAAALAQGASAGELQQHAERSGFESMQEQACSLVSNGRTTRQEMERVLGVETTSDVVSTAAQSVSAVSQCY